MVNVVVDGDTEKSLNVDPWTERDRASEEQIKKPILSAPCVASGACVGLDDSVVVGLQRVIERISVGMLRPGW